MKLLQRIARDRRTPGLACGRAAFTLKSAAGALFKQAPHSRTLTCIIRLFELELERISPADYPLAAANLKAAVRARGGGIRWVTLASWTGTEPVEKFYQEARRAWRSLPRENESQKVVLDGDGIQP